MVTWYQPTNHILSHLRPAPRPTVTHGRQLSSRQPRAVIIRATSSSHSNRTMATEPLRALSMSPPRLPHPPRNLRPVTAVTVGWTLSQGLSMGSPHRRTLNRNFRRQNRQSSREHHANNKCAYASHYLFTSQRGLSKHTKTIRMVFFAMLQLECMLYKLYIYQYLFRLHFHCDILLLQRVISIHGIIHLNVHVIHFTLVCVVLFFKSSIPCFYINCFHRFILIRYDFSNAFFFYFRCFLSFFWYKI